MDMLRRNRVKSGLIALVVILTLGIAGASLAVAGGSGGYDEPLHIQELQSARGLVYDWAETFDSVNEERDWMISGEWTLNCQTACAKAQLHEIDFDMGFAMLRESVKSEGNTSHGHTFWGFSATNVEVVEAETTTSLVINGTITGSGPLLTDDITIRLVKNVNGHFAFFFKLSDFITTEVGGVVVESKGR